MFRWIVCMGMVGCAGSTVETAVPPSEPVGVVDPAPEAEVEPKGDESWAPYGAAFTQDEVIGADVLLASLETYDGQRVRVEGRITDVCQKAGCWMVMAHQEQSIRVKMKDHDFAVDKGSTGGWADVEGEVHSKPLDPDEVAHFESEAGNPDAIPEHQMADKVYELVASAVRIRR